VNLLTNAAKYTPHGGQVVFQARRESDAAVIRVKDTGVGIPKGMLDTIFELFVQSRRTLDRSAGGLGVGLSLVRSLVDMHGGNVVAYSQGEGTGCEFVVRLPLSGALAVVDESEPEEPYTKAAGRCAVPDGATVLVVEDNADSRELLREVLERAGFKVVAAENGSTALELLQTIEP